MRNLSNQEIAAYRRDGVAFLPGAVDSAWVDKLLKVVDERLANPGEWVNDARWWPHVGSDPTVSQEDVTVQPGEYPADDKVFPVVWTRA